VIKSKIKSRLVSKLIGWTRAVVVFNINTKVQKTMSELQAKIAELLFITKFFEWVS
jgi:hypothetical protein